MDPGHWLGRTSRRFLQVRQQRETMRQASLSAPARIGDLPVRTDPSAVHCDIEEPTSSSKIASLPPGRPSKVMLAVPGIVVFSAALLAFQVQPLVARYLLPRFGGGSSVWTVCLLFFQVTLTLGYAYAHWVARRFSLKHQLRLHSTLLIIALATLPVLPRVSFEADPLHDPAASLLLFLCRYLGLPFLLLTATSPLVQSWCARVRGDAAYRLYGLSNLGSFLGLLSHPFLLEPSLGLQAQSLLWSGIFGAFVLATIVCWRAFAGVSTTTLVSPADPDASGERPPSRPRFMWFMLPAVASVLLFATTSRMTQDIAPVPLLWILPLGLYLVAFMLAFSAGPNYSRRVWIPLAVLSMVSAVRLLHLDHADEYAGSLTQLVVNAAVVFTCCRVVFGELVRGRPDARDLTSFYLAVAAGGAMGGCFVALLAPRIFDGYWELHLAYWAIAFSVGTCVYRSTREWGARQVVGALGWAAGLVLLAHSLLAHAREEKQGAVLIRRSFHGVLSVFEDNAGLPSHYYSLYHGRIRHGDQYLRLPIRLEPSTYYLPSSGVGLTLLHHPSRGAGAPGGVEGESAGLRVGTIGLGVGTVAAYGRRSDSFRFYELDPNVLEIARSHFRYLEDTPARVEIALGDARVSLERELRERGPQLFDVLIVDAFSGDSIPTHLLTREAFELYWTHLKSDGILVVHTSNRYLKLAPVVRALAQEQQRRCAVVETEEEMWSEWVLITRNEEFLDLPEVRAHIPRQEVPRDSRLLWSDDHSSLLRVMSFGE